ncbi:hypothetical protein B0A54_07827 [Friedmanniomyces endolithicus]|uniref:Uncharacterized protein n=1 Tax=Friedmanniomyces endolithicus TaxID=329885 RepID=A0A4U0V030_9PEZI|nr:hypothetical protein B0A54_07827 [Friedmanniomyces endolithicus]
MDLPFNTHPLYTLRKATILSATVGVIFSLGATSPYGSDAFQVEIFLVLVSLVFSAADVYYYAKFKKENPDQDPPWPTTKWMLADGVLAVLLLLDFAAGLWMAQLDWSYRRNGMILPAYAALAAFFYSAMEEGLLIGSEFGTGYGSISTPEPEHAHDVTLEQPAEVVVGSSSKPKGKKKAVDKRKGESLETWIRQT